MTNDPMLEKWIEENRFPRDGNKNPEHQSFVIREVDLRTFMAGKRIVEDVPVAWRRARRSDGGYDLYHSDPNSVHDNGCPSTPLYAPIGTGVERG